MNKSPVYRPKKGFTLIELLTVIAIIGVLAAIIIPAVGGVLDNAKRRAAQASLKGIAIGYKNFSTGGSRSRTINDGAFGTDIDNRYSAANSYDWARVLAYNADVNEAPVYFVDSAPDVAGIPRIPQLVLKPDGSEADGWTSATQEAISYSMSIEIPPNSTGNITPVIWTKGHDGATGTWDADSPWVGAGGHIAFLDGHVSWYDNTEDQLIDPDGETTSSIEDAAADTVVTPGGSG